MCEIKNLSSLVNKLRDRAAKVRKDSDISVVVGYTQSYAVYVHENLTAQHPVGKAKYLEGPARELSKELGEITSKAVAQGKTLAQALLLAGLRLQRESQKECPVETGALKNSAFTQLENK